MSGEFEKKKSTNHEKFNNISNQTNLRNTYSLMSRNNLLKGAKRSNDKKQPLSSDSSNSSHHIFKSPGFNKKNNGINDNFDIKKNQLPFNQSINNNQSENVNDDLNSLPDNDNLDSHSDNNLNELPNNEDSDLAENNLNELSNNDNQDDNAVNKGKAMAIEKGIQTAAKTNAIANVLVNNPLGKKVTKKVSDSLAKKQTGVGPLGFFNKLLPFGGNNGKKRSTSGFYSLKVKTTLKIISFVLPAVLVIVFFACIIQPVLSTANSSLGALFLANKLKDPESAKKLLDSELEKFSSDTDSDTYFSNMSNDNNSATVQNNNSSNNNSSGTENSSVYVKSQGGFKGKIHYYCQQDYTDPNSYGSIGSIKDYGCGPTALAIAISSILDEEHDPVELANYVCKKGGCTYDGSSFLIMQDTAKHYGDLYGFDVIITTDEELVKSKLSEGNSLVVTMTNGGFCTNDGIMLSSKGHFFVLTGVADEKNVYMVDPYTSANTGQIINLHALSINSNNSAERGKESYYILSKRG